jgi:hypothetical protein
LEEVMMDRAKMCIVQHATWQGLLDAGLKHRKLELVEVGLAAQAGLIH